MIEGIRGKNTLKVWNNEPCKKLPEDIQEPQEPAREKMAILNAMVKCPEDLWAIPSLRAEKLSGDRKGQWSIRINSQWRICFFWSAETQAVTQVEIADYHRTMKTKAQTLGSGPKIHPGVILKKYVLEERALNQSQFAAATGLPVSRINEIINGKRGITVDAAIRFAKVLGTSEGMWLNLQAAYDRACALEARGDEYARLKPLPKPASKAA